MGSIMEAYGDVRLTEKSMLGEPMVPIHDDPASELSPSLGLGTLPRSSCGVAKGCQPLLDEVDHRQTPPLSKGR